MISEIKNKKKQKKKNKVTDRQTDKPTDQPTDRQEKIKKDQEDMQIFFSQAHGPKSYIKFFGSRD